MHRIASLLCVTGLCLLCSCRMIESWAISAEETV